MDMALTVFWCIIVASCGGFCLTNHAYNFVYIIHFTLRVRCKEEFVEFWGNLWRVTYKDYNSVAVEKSGVVDLVEI